MAHSSEARWAEVARRIADRSGALVEQIEGAESLYRDLLEIFQYAGGTDADMAALLFKEAIEERQESGPNQEEIDKVTDLRNATVAMHELYQAANNVAVVQDDRFAALRRMS